MTRLDNTCNLCKLPLEVCCCCWPYITTTWGFSYQVPTATDEFMDLLPEDWLVIKHRGTFILKNEKDHIICQRSTMADLVKDMKNPLQKISDRKRELQKRKIELHEELANIERELKGEL